MSIYAIGDLHLPGGVGKTMDKFGWMGHKEKIFADWEEKVGDEDAVLLVGDISWAMNLQQAEGDLLEISAMKGKKFMIRGNHDYWWSGLAKMSALFPQISFVQNNSFLYEDCAVCGSRGWLCPNDVWFTPKDLKIYQREVGRLRLSLEKAAALSPRRIIAMIHYPPMNDKHEPSLFTDLFESFSVSKVVYGHLHGEESFPAGFQGRKNGVDYRLVSCDYTEFKLKKIL
ncbi:MAG: metallophosphoesterase [Peptostreptococcaceae bacterium]|nr:metallophosphoesterase [Peptostreptococcaceae bacterium]